MAEKECECRTVLCPKTGKPVPVYVCLGSFIQQRETCPNVKAADLNFPQKEGTVTCGRKNQLKVSFKLSDVLVAESE